MVWTACSGDYPVQVKRTPNNKVTFYALQVVGAQLLFDTQQMEQKDTFAGKFYRMMEAA
jgi:hypothetical protein